MLGYINHSMKFSRHLLTKLLLNLLLFFFGCLGLLQKRNKKRDMEEGSRKRGKDDRGPKEINQGLLYEVKRRERKEERRSRSQ